MKQFSLTVTLRRPSLRAQAFMSRRYWRKGGGLDAVVRLRLWVADPRNQVFVQELS